MEEGIMCIGIQSVQCDDDDHGVLDFLAAFFAVDGEERVKSSEVTHSF